MKESKNDIKTDKCILCGSDSGIPLNTPIENRINYISGCGQLCESCSNKIKVGQKKK